MTDYSLWEVINNGNKVLRRTVGTIKQEYKPTTAEEKQDRRNEMKARVIMLMALPNKDQLKFHSYQDAKLLMEAIGKRNKVEIETITLDDLYNNLKIYEPEHTGSSSTSQNAQNVAFVSNSTNNTNSTNKADNTAHGVRDGHADNQSKKVYQENKEEAGHKWFLRNQENKGREINSRTVLIKTSTQNALIAQDEIRGYDWSYQAEEEQPTNYALMAFTSLESYSSSDSEVESCSKTCMKAYATLKEQYDSLSSDYKKSQFNLLSYKAGLELVEARLAHYKKNEVVFEESINVLKLEVRLRDNALNEYKINLEKAEKERDQLKQTLGKFQNSSKSLNNLLESQVIDKFKTGLGYDAATTASPAVESFVNLTDEIVKSENLDVTTVVTPCNDKTVENKGVSNTAESNAVRMNNTSALIIKDWNSDDKSEIDYTVRPSTKKIKYVKTVRETYAPKQHKHHPRGNQRNWNNLMSQRLGSDFKMTNKACYVCGSFEHLHYVCDKKVVRPVWNNSRRVNHKIFTNKMTHLHPKRSFVPQAVLTRPWKLSTAGAAVNTVKPVNTVNNKAVNTVRSVNTAASKPIVNNPRTKTNAFKRGYSQSLRPFNKHFANKNSIINTNVNTARVKHTTARDRVVVSKNKGKGANAVKASACWGNPQQKEYKEKSVIDSGCSMQMTGNKCYLDEYEDYDGGFVSFSDGKGKISGK
ncbi:hypothetical protein Tco_1397301, partial [Tanacetum coccineum]